MLSRLENSLIGDMGNELLNVLMRLGAFIQSQFKVVTLAMVHMPIIIPIVLIVLSLLLFFSKSIFTKIIALPYTLVRRFFRLIHVIRDHRTWGVVYDSVTKEPIDPAYITVRGRLGTTIATAITDLDGRFGIVVPQGNYTLTVEKTNYVFPSVRLFGKRTDGYYSGLYFGGQFEVTMGERALAFAIPLDPIKNDWNQTEKKRKHMNTSDRKEARYAACLYFLVAGVFIYTHYAFVQDQIWTDLLWVYTGILVIAVLYAIFAPPMYYHSLILDKITQKPIGFARVKVFNYENHIQLSTKISSLNGQFVCLVPNGMYYLTVERRNDTGLYTLAYTSAPFRVVDRSISRQFLV